jgi:hypothetical protein
MTLCGEKTAITLWAAKPSWKDKFSSLLGHQAKQNVREQL